jgi:hypothetical protein
MTTLLDFLWRNNTASGQFIVALIFILGAMGSFCALSHWRRYRNSEKRWLLEVRDRLRRAQEATQTPSGEPGQQEEQPVPSAARAVELHQLSEGIPLTSIIGDRLQTIARMKQAQVKVNVEALQQSSMLRESADSTLALPGYVVSLVMMLGLLGTFIGLSFMVVDIQQALPGGGTEANANQWAASVNGLGRILAGKKTAFSATLAGLAFSILVSAMNFALARAQSELYDRLERFTTEELLPATVPSFDDETPWVKLSMQLGDSFTHIKELTAEQTRSTQRLIAVENTFAAIIENIERITQRAATAPLQGMAGEIAGVIGQLTQVNGAIVTLTDKLPQIISAFRHTHHATLTEIQTAMQAQQTALDRLSHALQNHGSGGRFGAWSFIAAGATAVLLIVILLQRAG